MTKEQIETYLSQPVLGTPVGTWFLFLISVLILFIVINFVLKRTVEKLQKRVEASKTNIDDYLLKALKSTLRFAVLALSVLIALIVVPGVPQSFYALTKTFLLIVLYIQVGMWGNNFIANSVESSMVKLNISGGSAQSASSVVKFFSLLLLWSGIFVLILSTMGIPVAPLVAGLGVGGIAIGFALQKILGDIFCSVAIILDKPFEIGDFIIVGSELGAVERIGIKTTRVRSLGGEQIIFSNADLLDSRVRNYKRMLERRVVFAFGVIYQTPPDKLEQIPGIVQDIIKGLEGTRFDRAHFKDFGASSLNFEVVYYVLTGDFNIYMDKQQAINLAIMRALIAEGVEFAYPTQTLHVETFPKIELVNSVAAN